MNEHVKPAWIVARSADFDLKSFALGVMEIAKENLERDGYLVPISFIVTQEEIQCVSVEFDDHVQKETAYAELVTAAKTAPAIALLTCNDAYWKKSAGSADLDDYYPGKLAAEGAKECIMLTVSGPSMQTWCVDLPYDRVDKAIRFGEPSESLGEEIGFLENWRTGTARAQ
jgi:hypothetical protein